VRRHARFAVQGGIHEIAGEARRLIPFDENNAQFVINARRPPPKLTPSSSMRLHRWTSPDPKTSFSQPLAEAARIFVWASELTGELSHERIAAEAEERRTASWRCGETFMKQIDVDAGPSEHLVQRASDHRRDWPMCRPAKLKAYEEFDERSSRNAHSSARWHQGA